MFPLHLSPRLRVTVSPRQTSPPTLWVHMGGYTGVAFLDIWVHLGIIAGEELVI